MTGWTVLNNFLSGFPFVATALFIIVALSAAVIFVIGFTSRGVEFIKYGLSNKPAFGEFFEKLATKEDIARLETDISGLKSEITGVKSEITGIKADITGMKTEIADIKVNHFGHLKNYLGVLNGILLDKGIIDNESRARLDNELRGM